MIDRRNFIRAAGAVTCGVGVGVGGLGVSELSAAKAKLADGASHAEKLGWRFGALFNCFYQPVFYDNIEEVASLGLHYIEGAARPTLSKERSDVHLDDSMSDKIRKEVKMRLADAGVNLVSYYSQKLTADEKECRREFEFAKDMGIETLIGEPPPESFDMIESFCDEYQINMAIHNHAVPSRYWNPDTLMEVCKGRSKRVGACCDTGHWIRSGLNAPQEIKKLGDRIITFHLKEMNKIDDLEAYEVAWGTGEGDVRGMLKAVYQLGLKPLFIIEYHHHGPNLMAELAQCVEYFDKVAAELLGND